MESREEGKFIFVKLEQDEDFFEKIKEVVKEHAIESASIINGIGMLKEVTLAYWNGKEYVKNYFEGPLELTSLQGNISKDEEGNVIVHVHVNLACKEKNIIGGHLISGKVNVVNEITILRFNFLKLKRKFDEKLNLKAIYIE